MSSLTKWPAVWAVDVALLLFVTSFTSVFVFVIAYGFDDDITTEDHVFFLAQFGFCAVLWGVLLGLVNLAMVRHKPSGFVFGMALSLFLHLAVLAVGTVVSMANEGANSVTAGQAHDPFIALTIASAVLAVGCLALAVRAQRRKEPIDLTGVDVVDAAR